jgi:nicotinamide mononucleotide adenylyltransferase/ADP-ribose pyrophosphatase YjhB (NUDIX family)
MNVRQLADIAIIIGRYQTHTLHPEQIRMIDEVIKRHPRTIIVLGNSLMRGTIANPLDFRARKTMIQEKFPKIDILYINDIPKDNALWSNNLDKLIKDNIRANETVAVYGSKDTFITKYNGKFATFAFEASSFVSADELRRQASTNYQPNEQYRAGIVAAQANRHVSAYQCVDVAIIDDKARMLMARKQNETKLRFIGGFSDVNSPSLEIDARREVAEEASIEVDGMTYLGSCLVADSRYFFELDKIKTAFFVAKYIFGRPEAKDDICEVAWIPINELKKENVIDAHHVLVDMFNEKFIKNETLYKQYIKGGY